MARVKRRITRSVYAGAYRLLPMSFGVKKSHINGNALIDLYREADIFVLPTRADTHALANRLRLLPHQPATA